MYSDLKKLETIAPRIKKRHEEFQERRRKQQEALKALEGSGARNLSQELDELSLQDRRSDRRSYDSRPTLDASEHQSLATRLAQREVRRRDTARRSVRQHGVSEEEEQQRRTGGRWESWQDELAHDDGRGDLMHQLQEVARLQQDGSNGQRTAYTSVGSIVLISLWVTNSCSNLLPGTRTPTTTQLYPINPLEETSHSQPRKICMAPQLDRRKSNSIDPQARRPYRHLYLPSRQQPHKTSLSTAHDHHQYLESMQNHNPLSRQSPAKSLTTVPQPPRLNSMTSPSSPRPISKMATHCAPSFCLPNYANNSYLSPPPTRV